MDGRTIKVSDVASGNVLISVAGNRAALSADGKHLATSGGSRDVSVWDIDIGDVVTLDTAGLLNLARARLALW
jgi:hypothetical protein